MTPEQVKHLQEEGDLWHRRLGHISSDYVHKLKLVVEGIGELISTATVGNCKVCAESKITRKVFSKDPERATRVGEVMHADIIGKISPPTFISDRRKQYVLCVIDNYS